MTYIGFEIDIRAHAIFVRAKEKSRIKLLAAIDQVLASDSTAFHAYDVMLGLWSHASTVIKLWRVWQNPVFVCLRWHYQQIQNGADRHTLMVDRTEPITNYCMMLKGEIAFFEPFRKFSWAPWLIA